MKPFDLDKALAGSRVVTKEGDGIALRALQSWADQDELYETVEPPTDKEEIK